jgi:hypothetical protein
MAEQWQNVSAAGVGQAGRDAISGMGTAFNTATAGLGKLQKLADSVVEKEAARDKKASETNLQTVMNEINSIKTVEELESDATKERFSEEALRNRFGTTLGKEGYPEALSRIQGQIDTRFGNILAREEKQDLRKTRMDKRTVDNLWNRYQNEIPNRQVTDPNDKNKTVNLADLGIRGQLNDFQNWLNSEAVNNNYVPDNANIEFNKRILALDPNFQWTTEELRQSRMDVNAITGQLGIENDKLKGLEGQYARIGGGKGGDLYSLPSSAASMANTISTVFNNPTAIYEGGWLAFDEGPDDDKGANWETRTANAQVVYKGLIEHLGVSADGKQSSRLAEVMTRNGRRAQENYVKVLNSNKTKVDSVNDPELFSVLSKAGVSSIAGGKKGDTRQFVNLYDKDGNIRPEIEEAMTENGVAVTALSNKLGKIQVTDGMLQDLVNEMRAFDPDWAGMEGDMDGQELLDQIVEDLESGDLNSETMKIILAAEERRNEANELYTDILTTNREIARLGQQKLLKTKTRVTR